MKIVVNSKEMEIPENYTVTQLLAQLQISSQGMAVGVNNKLITRNEWDKFVLKENDQLVIIKAACGG